MFDPVGFTNCIRKNLQERKYGKERADVIIKDFERRAKTYFDTGLDNTTANTLAMKDLFQNMSDMAMEKAKRTAKMISVQAENNRRIASAMDVDIRSFTAADVVGKQKGPRGSRGAALARAAISLIEDDPRFKGSNFTTLKNVNRGQLWALGDNILEKMGKGTFGVQRGKAYMPNVVREIFGERTGDDVAAQLAQSWLKIADVGVDLFNQAGGSLKKLDRYIPQQMNASKMVSIGEDEWVKDHLGFIDWNKTRYDDGSVIQNREEALRRVFKTLTSNGANKIDDTAFRGAGKSLGNKLEQHRFLHYKDADSWLQMHDKYGDGNVFDVMSHHVDSMAHKIAALEIFGPNPELTFKNIQAIVKKNAAGLSAKDKVDADRVLKNTFAPMYDAAMHNNPLDPNSNFGAMVTGVSNILTAAQLGSASLLAIPGDFAQTAMVHSFNKMGLFKGIDFYIKGLITDPHFMEKIATQSGFVHDEVVMNTYAAQRFTGLATYGPSVTRRISDNVMRASLLSGHTKSARFAVEAEFMGMLHRMADTPYDQLPFKGVLDRAGITSDEWDVVRKAYTPWEPRQGIQFMRPVDFLNMKTKNKDQLFRKFQSMIFNEARRCVPASTIEATVALKASTRQDTIPGAILHSFAMYKNFPLSFQMIYGRLAMTSPSVRGRLGFYAALGASMTTVGALGVQLRELLSGRDPMPMNTPMFLGKAFLAGGAMSIWGDYLFGGVNDGGSGPASVAAGPLGQWAQDTTQLAFGDIFKWANTVGTLDANGTGNFPAHLVTYMKRYTPGSNVWWARAALEREVWDRLSEIADPKAYRKEQNRIRFQQKTYGNDYYWPPGERTPDRLPQYIGSQ